MDIKSPMERSRNMAAIKSKNTSPEILIRHQLFKRGFRYRVNYEAFPGKPDLFLRKYNTAIFINGCFWHQHSSCKQAYMPKTNIDKWKTKLSANIERDKRNIELLYSQGIRVLIIWECTIKTAKKSEENLEVLLNNICNFLIENKSPYLEI